MGHVVKNHAFGCAGPDSAVGKWDNNARIQLHNYFIYTLRVCDKMCLAGQLAAGACCEFIGFPNNILIFTLLRPECLLR